MLTVAFQGVLVPRVDARMEDRHLTHFLNLYKREKWPFFKNRLAKSLAEVMSIFVKVYDSSVHINEHSNDGSDNKLVVPGFSGHFPVVLGGALRIEVAPPLFVVENVSSVQIEAPDVLLSREILVY
jgi:hypothetical protein